MNQNCLQLKCIWYYANQYETRREYFYNRRENDSQFFFLTPVCTHYPLPSIKRLSIVLPNYAYFSIREQCEMLAMIISYKGRVQFNRLWKAIILSVWHVSFWALSLWIKGFRDREFGLVGFPCGVVTWCHHKRECICKAFAVYRYSIPVLKAGKILQSLRTCISLEYGSTGKKLQVLKVA